MPGSGAHMSGVGPMYLFPSLLPTPLAPRRRAGCQPRRPAAPEVSAHLRRPARGVLLHARGVAAVRRRRRRGGGADEVHVGLCRVPCSASSKVAGLRSASRGARARGREVLRVSRSDPFLLLLYLRIRRRRRPPPLQARPRPPPTAARLTRRPPPDCARPRLHPSRPLRSPDPTCSGSRRWLKT